MAESTDLVSKLRSADEQLQLTEDFDSLLCSKESISEISDVVDEFVSQSADLWSGEDLLSISDREFELLIGLLYTEQGYRAGVTPETRDGGVDIILVKEGLGILIEAKQLNSGTVPVGQVRELHSVAKDVHSLPYDICSEVDEVGGIAVFTTGKLSNDAANRLDRADEQEKFTAWVADSQAICDMLNLNGISRVGWEKKARNSVKVL